MTWTDVMVACIVAWGVSAVLLGGGMAIRWMQGRMRP